MRNWCVWILLIFAPGVLLSAQDDAGLIKSRIIALEKAWNQAYKLRDTKAIDSLLSDDVVLVNDDGSLQNKIVFLNLVRSSQPSEEEQVTPESIGVTIAGEVAIATGVFVSKGVRNGKPYVRRDRFVDTWIKQRNNWVCASASATPVLH